MESIFDIKYAYSSKRHEFDMLSRTLTDMYERKAAKSSIEAVEAELDGLSKEVENLRLKLKSACGMNEAESKKSFYDKLEKMDKAKEEVKVEAMDNDNVIRSNHFLVSFDETNLKISSYYIKRVSIDTFHDVLMIEFYNFVDKNTKSSILYDIQKNELSDIGNIKINYLDKKGYTLYSEVYKDCTIEGYNKNSLDYNDDSYSLISLIIKYNKVVYESGD
jgi:hypothetical protein